MKGIKEYTREQLLQMAIPYFKKNSTMIATSDGNFFYPKDEHYADAHSRSNKFQKFILKRNELKKPTKTEKVDEQNEVKQSEPAETEKKVEDKKTVDKLKKNK